MTDEIHLKVLRVLQEQPDIKQRELASALGISLGKANYCLQALIDKGLIKANRFRTSQNKSAYAYLLTPKGMVQKADLTVKYLQIKMREYDRLKAEIAQLEQETKLENA